MPNTAQQLLAVKAYTQYSEPGYLDFIKPEIWPEATNFSHDMIIFLRNICYARNDWRCNKIKIGQNSLILCNILS